MKRLFTIFATFAMLCAVGCEEQGGDDVTPNDKPDTEQPGEKPDDGSSNTEEPEEQKPEYIFFGLDRESVSISPDGGSVDVVVYSNYKWKITGTSDWCTPSATSGEANEDGQKVTFSADVAYDTREAIFWFRCADEEIKFVVSQNLKEVIIADENNTFSVPAEGGIVTIAYQTSIECEVIIPDEAKEWITFANADATRGLVAENINLNIAENTTHRERSAVVKVVAANNNELFAEYTITQNQGYFIKYTSKDGFTVSPYSSEFGATIIRNEYIDGKGYIDFDAPITSIGNSAFRDCSSLTSITIPDSVTSIGDYAFKGCTSLKSVTIPDSVTSIGAEAFYDCYWLTSVYITDIAAWCNISFAASFSNPLCYAENLYLNNELVTDLIIPDSVTSIGNYAFEDCDSLKSVTIPDSVTSIGDDAFSNCKSLTSITIPDSVTSIGAGAFYICSSLTSITIPDSVTSIGDEAFSYCTSLTRITIPDSVTSIGNYAFYECSSLTNVTIPDSVTSIGEGAFSHCTSLTSVTIPDSVTSIEVGAFDGCTSLTSVYCKPTTPPRGRYNMFANNASERKIYVPTKSVNAYKSAEHWSEYADDIVGYDFE